MLEVCPLPPGMHNPVVPARASVSFRTRRRFFPMGVGFPSGSPARPSGFGRLLLGALPENPLIPLIGVSGLNSLFGEPIFVFRPKPPKMNTYGGNNILD